MGALADGVQRPTASCEGVGQPPHPHPVEPPEFVASPRTGKPLPFGTAGLYGRKQCSSCKGHYFPTKNGTIPRHPPKARFDWERG